MTGDLVARAGAAAALAIALLVSGCATLPPTLDVPKPASTALANPEATSLGKRFEARSREHPGQSGFRLLVDGTNSFVLRQEMAAKAERTLDVQYFPSSTATG